MDVTPAPWVGTGCGDAPAAAVCCCQVSSWSNPSLGPAGAGRDAQHSIACAGGCWEPRGASKAGETGDVRGRGEPSPARAGGDAVAGGPRQRIHTGQGLRKRRRLRGRRGGPTGWWSPRAGGWWEGASEPAGRPCRMGSGHGLIGRAAARRGRLLAGGHKLFCLRSRSRHRLGLAGPGAVQPLRAELATGASSQTHPGSSGCHRPSLHARKCPGGQRGFLADEGLGNVWQSPEKGPEVLPVLPSCQEQARPWSSLLTGHLSFVARDPGAIGMWKHPGFCSPRWDLQEDAKEGPIVRAATAFGSWFLLHPFYPSVPLRSFLWSRSPARSWLCLSSLPLHPTGTVALQPHRQHPWGWMMTGLRNEGQTSTMCTLPGLPGPFPGASSPRSFLLQEE